MTLAAGIPVIIGRDEELGSLERLLDGARSGQGHAVFLIGDEGIGKSRLVREMTSQGLASGMCLMPGRGSPIGPAVPLRPFTEGLQYLCRDGRPAVGDDLGPYAAILGCLVPDFGPPPSGCRDSTPGLPSVIAFAEAVLRLAAVVGRERGCLIILEDLHFADAGTLAVIEYLADNLGGQPVALLATMRAEQCDALDVARATAERASAMILTMTGLSREEVRALVAARLRVKPDDIPSRAADRIWQDSAGNPSLAVALLPGLADQGRVTSSPNGVRRPGEMRRELPGLLVHRVTQRASQLGPRGSAMLTAAAVVGRRFPLPVIQAVTGLDDAGLLGHLQAAVDAGLVTASEPSPAWYSFVHPLIAEALLRRITPAARAWHSHRAAVAVETLYPALLGEWCQLAATLRLASGSKLGASRLLVRAGTQALAEGRLTSAVDLLHWAWEILADSAEVGLRADVLDALLEALAETGQASRALRFADGLCELRQAGLEPPRLAALCTRLGWVASIAGRWSDGLAHLETARALLAAEADEAAAAAVHVAAAELALQAPGERPEQAAEALACHASAAEGSAYPPTLRCRAWLLRGVLARMHDTDEAARCFERARAFAHAHRLAAWHLRALVQLGVDHWLTEGHTARLQEARQKAKAYEAITIGCGIDANIAFGQVLSGDYASAALLLRDCRAEAHRLSLAGTRRHVLMIQAILAGHQGKRRDMDKALAEFRHLRGERSHLMPLTLGLARAFCALLEEDPDRARQEMTRAIRRDAACAGLYPLAGRHGLHLLLEVIAGEADWPEYEKVIASTLSQLRWNRQFALFARAVLLGRDGCSAEAAATIAQAERAAAPFATARHLGLRLVGEAASGGGWGEPAVWLRRAEEYFHDASIPAPAIACRALLRQAGAPVPQRRSGANQVPSALRKLGVTVREYEVLQLLVNRPGNRAIADQLHISPRTVEKHMANLMLKTGQPDRARLCDFASALPDSVTAGAA